ncbi:MAG: hypothetical protein ACRD68_16560, partial [Pyrinomonadaceae bacterium]
MGVIPGDGHGEAGVAGGPVGGDPAVAVGGLVLVKIRATPALIRSATGVKKGIALMTDWCLSASL